jgi:glycosyltransferase involved in cell wall biosynthesis
MVTPLCSTIIPTINRSTLARAVTSALEQSLEPAFHEVIVVNDSGTPLTEAAWLHSPQVRVINTNRCERSTACNVGAAASSGRYLKFLHDDDYLLPGALATLLCLAERSDCAWVYGALRRMDNDGNFLSLNRPEVKGNLFGLLVCGETLHLGPALIRRAPFVRVGGFDPTLALGEDRDLACRLALFSDFDGTTEEVACVRVGVVGSTSDWGLASSRNRSRLIREKALNLPGAGARIQDSIRGNSFLRGRVCRAILFSGVLNFRAGHLRTGWGRLAMLRRLMSREIFVTELWRGMRYAGTREN